MYWYLWIYEAVCLIQVVFFVYLYFVGWLLLCAQVPSHVMCHVKWTCTWQAFISLVHLETLFLHSWHVDGKRENFFLQFPLIFLLEKYVSWLVPGIIFSFNLNQTGNDDGEEGHVNWNWYFADAPTFLCTLLSTQTKLIWSILKRTRQTLQ